MQKRSNKSYKAVFFEIIGNCNGNCPYCHSGRNKIGKGDIISVDKFNKVLEKLLDEMYTLLEKIIRK